LAQFWLNFGSILVSFCVNYSVQRTAYSVQRTAYSVQRTAYSVQRTAYSVQRTAYSVQRTAYSVQRTAYSVQRTAYSLQRTAYSVQRTAFQECTLNPGLVTKSSLSLRRPKSAQEWPKSSHCNPGRVKKKRTSHIYPGLVAPTFRTGRK
jgi:hypothetical protein